MPDISRLVIRSVKTDIAGSVVVTPSGGSTGTPIVAADLVNGFAPITINFAAGETSKPAVFPVADDSLVEGTETYRLTMSNPLPSGIFPEGAFVEGTVDDNDLAPPAITMIYGPENGAGDSGVIDLKSTRQQLGRTWRAAAPKWKATVGSTEGNVQQAGLIIRFNDTAGTVQYLPRVGINKDANAVTVNYTGAGPSATEPYTFLVSDAQGIRYYCSATADGANARLLLNIPYAIWDDAVFWTSQIDADRVPGKFAESNADEAVANGIYAARIGAIQ